ncbi:thermonuclease family protein [Paenibacillus durus]|uniref:thermonuclease family protein n=1 Tax=Paenibacillus durus TaxID=44251 RepID=UPI0006943C59|nr:excalibur calcium-binding domain-containing protein [Paenibacillus durus]
MFKSKRSLVAMGFLLLIEIAIFSGIPFSEALAVNFFLLTLFFFVAWLVGLIKPSLVLRWGDSSRKTRKIVSLYCLGSTVLSFILFISMAATTKSPLEQVFDEQQARNNDNVLATSVITYDAAKNVERTPSISANSTKFIEAQVVSVTAGDTFTVKLKNGSKEKVRLILVDTPETKHPDKPVQPFGPEASTFTTKLLTGKTVKLELDVSERDKYGRLFAYAYLGDRMVNELLLEKGYARVAVFPPNVKYVDQFRAIQKKAQETTLGIWSIEDYATDSGFNDNVVVAKASPKAIGTAKPSPMPAATAKPSTKPVTTKPSIEAVYYKNCTAVRAAGADPLYKGDPGYRSALDRDGDGIACETSSSSSSSTDSGSEQTITEPQTDNVYYKNCTAVRNAGAAPIYAGEPGYSRKLDRDGDGVACEK